jgi:hypothetical protein
MNNGLKKLPEYWWCFLPIWLWFPAFFGIIALIVRANLFTGFGLGCIYVLLTLLALVPIRRNRLSTIQALLWVGIGTITLGVPGVLLIYVVFA